MKVVRHVNVVSVNIEMSAKTYNSKFYTPNAISTLEILSKMPFSKVTRAVAFNLKEALQAGLSHALF